MDLTKITPDYLQQNSKEFIDDYDIIHEVINQNNIDVFLALVPLESISITRSDGSKLNCQAYIPNPLDSLYTAIKNNDISDDNLIIIYQRLKDRFPVDRCFERAMFHGRFELIKQMIELEEIKKRGITEIEIQSAIHGEQFELIKFILQKVDEGYFKVESNNIFTYHQPISKKLNITTKHICTALPKKNLEMISFLLSRCENIDKEKVIEVTCSFPNGITVLKYLIDNHNFELKGNLDDLLTQILNDYSQKWINVKPDSMTEEEFKQFYKEERGFNTLIEYYKEEIVRFIIENEKDRETTFKPLIEIAKDKRWQSVVNLLSDAEEKRLKKIREDKELLEKIRNEMLASTIKITE